MRKIGFPISSLVFLLFLGGPSPALDRVRHVIGTPGNEVRVVNTYPEYWVDGKPFVMHAAAFFYHRLPRDRWAAELVRLKAFGINTIDLYPLWNWHQPEEDVLDFSGRTNPRRDLKYLLRLLAELGFKVTCRPGPFFCNEWRNGGYPGWLLRRPEYRMSLQSVLEGRYPPLSTWMYDDSEQASAAALANRTHLNRTAEWFRKILGLVEPYLAEHGGNVLHIQIDDDEACFVENRNGPRFWQYMEVLRQAAKDATHGSAIPYYINGSEMRVNAEANDALPEPFWNMGQDYQMGEPGGLSDAMEAAKNKINTEALKTEPLFPPYIIEFGAGFRMKDKDSYETPAHDPSNILMASRVMFQNGLKGLNYFSLNDTLYPAGWEAPWGNYFYSREGAINYLGEEQGRAPYARRNGRLIAGLGALLGSAHALADAALVYPMGTFPQAEMSAGETGYIFQAAKRILWSGACTHRNFELVDADHNPQENLERYPLLLLFNPSNCEEETGNKAEHLRKFSAQAQARIREYLRAGGKVLVFPSLPGGDLFDRIFSPLGPARKVAGDGRVIFAKGGSGPLLGSRTVLACEKAPGVEVFARDGEGGIVGARYAHEKGQVVFFGGDFSRWAAPSLLERPEPPAELADYPGAVQVQAKAVMALLLDELRGAPRVLPESSPALARDPGLYVTQLAADSSRDTYGFVGVTNFDPERENAAAIVVADPGAQEAGRTIRLPRISLPARESLLLPLRLPLGHPWLEAGAVFAAGDEIYYATAELSRVQYDGRRISLEFTAPAEAEIALRLAGKPLHARLDGLEIPIETDADKKLYVLRLAKGAAPHFLRRLQVDYPRPVPGIQVAAQGDWIIGEPHDLSLRLDNPAATPFKGILEIRADKFQEPFEVPVEVAPGSSRDLHLPIQVPGDRPEGMVAEIEARLKCAGADAASRRIQATLQRALGVSIKALSAVRFPLREDQRVPIIHPTLACVNVPGTARLQVKLTNRSSRNVKVRIEARGAGLALSPAVSAWEIPAGQERTLELGATPLKGTGAYPCTITVAGPGLKTSEDVLLAAVAEHEALAYFLDYDRGGFPDLLMENRELRCFISPGAGGRSFALVRKSTGTNAFTSVGGMRDNFLTRIVPTDLQGKSEGVDEKRLGLFNRPYSSRILAPSGKSAVIRLEYEAPDIHPRGVRIVRTVTLPGPGSCLLESTEITPQQVAGRQAFIRESSFPFRKFLEANSSQWFVGTGPLMEFQPQTQQELPLPERVFGTYNKGTKETFAVILPAQPGRWWIENEVHSTYLRIQFPDLNEAQRTRRYDLAYYFGVLAAAEIRKLPIAALFRRKQN